MWFEDGAETVSGFDRASTKRRSSHHGWLAGCLVAGGPTAGPNKNKMGFCAREQMRSCSSPNNSQLSVFRHLLSSARIWCSI
jgi:hypothetical protein